MALRINRTAVRVTRIYGGVRGAARGRAVRSRLCLNSMTPTSLRTFLLFANALALCACSTKRAYPFCTNPDSAQPVNDIHKSGPLFQADQLPRNPPGCFQTLLWKLESRPDGECWSGIPGRHGSPSCACGLEDSKELRSKYSNYVHFGPPSSPPPDFSMPCDP